MTHKSRKQVLKDSIQFELRQPIPNLDAILATVDRYEQNNLNKIDKLSRKRQIELTRINGAIKDCINSHGYITKNNTYSLAKRIEGSLLSDEKEKVNKEILSYSIFMLSVGILIGLAVVFLK